MFPSDQRRRSRSIDSPTRVSSQVGSRSVSDSSSMEMSALNGEMKHRNSWWSWTDNAEGRRSSSSQRTGDSGPTGNEEEKEKGDARNFVLVSSLPKLLQSPEPTTEPALPVPSASARSFSGSFQNVSWRQSIKEVCHFLGPGWMVAMAYVDPGNLEGDLNAGALRSAEDPLVGYRLLWVLLWATLMGFGLQRLSIKLGTATGKDLATVCRMEFPKWLSVVIWIFTEICLVGADMQAVIGSAIGLKLLLGIPLSVGILITLLDTFIVLLIDFCGTRKLEACFALMLSLMAGCFFANMVTSKPDYSAIVRGLAFVSIPEGTMPFTIALIGSVIMPHNFFLQSAVVQSRSIDRSNTAQVNKVTRVYTYETFVLLFVSLLVNIAVVVAFANPNIHTPDGSPLDLYNAHTALESAIGRHSSWIWGLGLLAAGQCSTMACTYAGQFVMEGLLGLRIEKLWLRVFVTRITSIAPLLFIVYLSKGTVEWIANMVNVMQAFNLPFTLLLLLKFTSSPEVMGRFVLSTTSRTIASISGVLLIAANVSLITTQLGQSWVIVVLAVYFIMLGYLWQRPIEHQYCTRPSSDFNANETAFGVDTTELLEHHNHP